MDNQVFQSFTWLRDAPLFIDEHYVRRHYFAAIRPDWEVVRRSDRTSTEKTLGLEGKLAADLEASAEGGWLMKFLGFSAKAKVGGEVAPSIERKSEIGNDQESTRVDPPERRLVEIVAQYLTDFPERILYAKSSSCSLVNSMGAVMPVSSWMRLSPKPLVFLDVEEGSPILPTAAESTSGKYALIFRSVIKRLWSEAPGQQIPEFPEEGEGDRSAKTRAYWEALFARDRFSTRIIMECIEDASADLGRFEWINFQTPLGPGGESIHLNCVPRGQYSAGTFSYNLIRRGHHHGIRIVGTLRSGPALNVLAIYEK